jgi:RNA polymerase sigma factor (sigma-70 family)
MNRPADEGLVTEAPAPANCPALHPDDVDLVRGLLAGQAGAESTIRGWLVRYVAFPGFNIPPDEQEDIVQDAMTALFEVLHAGRFEGRARLKTFARVITFNKVQNFWRRWCRRKQRFQPLPDDPPYEDSSPGPDRIREQEELNERVKSALKALPERCRELIRLRAFEEPVWPFEKIAKLFGVKAALVRYWLYHCRRRLAELLAE